MTARSESSSNTFRWIWGLCCIAILCVILLAGLWPFCAPGNQVQWLPNQNGLQFGGRGVVIGDRPFRALPPGGPAVLEICLRPQSLAGSGTIMAFDDFPDPHYVFALRQFDGSLAVQRHAYEQRTLVREWWATKDVFAGIKPVVLTIASAQDTAVLYVNGVHVSESSLHKQLARDLYGTLVLGSSVAGDGWRGQIAGLAIYGSLLTPAEIQGHSARWLQGQSPFAEGEPVPLALYRFDERSGNTVHDEAAHAADALGIPSRFRLEHRQFLTPVWAAYRSRWDGWRTKSYWSDVAVNIAGFIPFGFFFAAWFYLLRFTSRPRLTALLLGIGISFLIESLQYFLPTRDSSMTDLLTNSIGAALGVALFRESLFRRWIAL